METSHINLLTIGFTKQALLSVSRERNRLKEYALKLGEYHIIVLTRRSHGFKDVVHDGPLHLYPTNSFCRPLMLVDAFCSARKILKGSDKKDWVISAQDPLEVGWLSWLIARVHTIRLHIQIHGDYFGSGWAGRSPSRHARSFLALMLLRKVPAIRVVSERIRASLIERHIPDERITVLPIRPELESFLEKVHTYRTEPPYTLLYVGRFAPEKDIPRILNAFAEVIKKRKDVRLKLVGKGSEKAIIEVLIGELALQEYVTITPWTEDVADEMNRADVFLLASQHEAYALTLVEAMAIGLPLITTNVGCVGEVVKDTEHGIVVYDENFESYAYAILKLIEDPDFMKACGRRGKESAAVLAQVTHEEYIKAWVTALS